MDIFAQLFLFSSDEGLQEALQSHKDVMVSLDSGGVHITTNQHITSGLEPSQ